MRVGEDILVTGFDDSEVATSLKPMLTTVRTNIRSMGYQSVQALVELIQTGKTRSRTLDARLIVRESCDPDQRNRSRIRQITVRRKKLWV